LKSFKQTWTDIHPAAKGLIFFLFGVLILFIIFQIILSLFGDRYAAHRLKNKVVQSTDSTYRVDFNDLDLHLYSGSIIIHKLHIHADTAAFHRESSDSKKPPSSLYIGTVGKIKVSGIHLLALLTGQKLKIGKILIENPDLTAIKNPQPVSEDTSRQFSTVDSSLYAGISDRYSALKVGKFAIKNARLASVKSRDTLTSVDQFNLTLNNIKVDSATAHSGRIFITDDISMQLRHLKMISSNELNAYKVGRLKVSSDHHSITIDSLHLDPLYPKLKFSEKNGEQIDRIDLFISKLKFNHVDFQTFIDSDKFHSGYAEINHAKFQDFHSMLPPSPPETKKELYNVSLIHLNQKIKIDTLKIKDSYISYAEYHKHAPKAGKVAFKKMSGTFHHLTNYQKAIEAGDTVKVEAQARVMGKGLLKVHWLFPLDTNNGFHKIRGSLSDMPLTAFNPALKDIAFVKIDKGKLNHLKFHFAADDDHSNGVMIMNYQNLEVSMLNKHTMKQTGVKKNVISFVANEFVVKSDNTPKDGMRAGKIQFKRSKTKSTWNFWWKSLLSGIKNSIK
jgi:hypothetical protein